MDHNSADQQLFNDIGSHFPKLTNDHEAEPLIADGAPSHGVGFSEPLGSQFLSPPLLGLSVSDAPSTVGTFATLPGDDTFYDLSPLNVCRNPPFDTPPNPTSRAPRSQLQLGPGSDGYFTHHATGPWIGDEGVLRTNYGPETAFTTPSGESGTSGLGSRHLEQNVCGWDITSTSPSPGTNVTSPFYPDRIGQPHFQASTSPSAASIPYGAFTFAPLAELPQSQMYQKTYMPINTQHGHAYHPGLATSAENSFTSTMSLPSALAIPRAFGRRPPSSVGTHSTAYTCSSCPRTFGTQSDLTHHERNHMHGDRPHPCEICDKSFLFLKDLRRHNGSRKHREKERDNPSFSVPTGSEPRQPYHCPVADCKFHSTSAAELGESGFSRKDHLLRHIQTQHPGCRLPDYPYGPNT